MLVSVRSHLIAGTAALAVAGVAAVAPLPAAAPAVPALPAASVAEVALTALNTPLQELLATLNVGQSYLLSSFYQGADGVVAGAGVANWPGAGFDLPGGDVLNFLLANEPALGEYINVGILPQLVNQATPIIRQLQTNLLSYANVALTGLTNWGIALNAGVWGFPPAFLDAAQLALGGDFQAALEVIGEAIITPVTAATQALLGAGGYILDNVVTRAAAVLTAIPQIATTYVGAFIGGAGLLIERTAALATAWAGEIADGNFAGAWNTAVAGLFGPDGLPGLALNLTIGAGVQTGPIASEADIADNFVPSIRTAVQGTAATIQNALETSASTPPPAPLASVRAAAAEQPSVAEVRADAADAAGAEEAVAADTAATDTAAAESSALAAAPAAEAEPAAKAPRAKRTVTRAAR